MRIHELRKKSAYIRFYKDIDEWLNVEETKCAIVGQGSAGKVVWEKEKILKMNRCATMFVSGDYCHLLEKIDWRPSAMSTTMVPSIGRGDVIRELEKHILEKPQ